MGAWRETYSSDADEYADGANRRTCWTPEVRWVFYSLKLGGDEAPKPVLEVTGSAVGWELEEEPTVQVRRSLLEARITSLKCLNKISKPY